MSLPIFVINLERSKERMNWINKYFKRDVLTRFEGFDHGTCEDEDRELDELKEPEIGCAKSHVAVWKKIVEEEIDMAVVLEDDVKPIDETKSILYSLFKNINYKVQDFDVLFIQKNEVEANGKIEESCKCDDDFNYLLGWGAHAYVMTYEGAKKSINAMEKIELPVDVQWMMAFEKCGLSCSWVKPEKNINAKVLRPPIICHSHMAAKSTMGAKKWTDKRYAGGFK